MDYRKVFLTKGDEENWPTLHDAESGTAVNCWRQCYLPESGEDPQCHIGCAAFCCPNKGEGDLVMCLALPRGPSGSPTAIGELVAAPGEDEDGTE